MSRVTDGMRRAGHLTDGGAPSDDNESVFGRYPAEENPPDHDVLRSDAEASGEPFDPPQLSGEPFEPRFSRWRWVIGGLFLLSVGVVAYLLIFGFPTAPPSATETPAVVETPSEPVRPLGAPAEPIEVPALDASDPLVRELLAKLSSHPRVAAWLATDNLIRGFAASTVNVAEGNVPRTNLAVLRPPSGFRIVEQGGSVYLDPNGYERYNAVADAVASVDPYDAARLYGTLKPRIEEAYRELGFPDGQFDRVLERALARLIETPFAKDPVQLKPLEEGIGYGFADPRLEQLTDAQKQLLRMGPRNALVVQGALREIAVALGIPPSRFPIPRQ